LNLLLFDNKITVKGIQLAIDNEPLTM